MSYVRRLRRAAVLTLLATALLPGTARGVGGKWTPEQLLEHDREWLAELGLELAPEELWRPEGGGLLEAVVKVSGCSSGFVSPEGLLITNHHCAFSILQQHSTAERDLIAGGYLAADRAGELPSATTRASIPHGFTDVTADIESAAAEAGDDLARYHAIDRREKELVAACEARPFRRCHVAAYDDGLRYTLVEALEFPDVRLVYAPPRSVGEYGGEVDNWEWPRHTGDFALLRVYAGEAGEPAPYAPDNLPYHPRRYLPVAKRSVEEGDFVMVVGYPGSTHRRLIAAEVAQLYELYYPRRSRLLRAWLDVLEAASKADPEARILLAGRIKSLANREKNARGQIAGIRRGDLLAERRRQEEAVLAWTAEHPEHQAAREALRELEALVAEERATWGRDFLLGQVGSGPLPLDHALTLVRWALEGEKPDLERDPEFQERNRERTARGLERDQQRLHPATERRLLADFLTRLAALPAEQRIPVVGELLGDDPGTEAADREAGRLLAETRVTDLSERMAMFAESPAELRQRHDPLLELAFRLVEEAVAPKVLQDHRHQGAVSRLRPVWRRAVIAQAGRPVAPDANRTLRVSLAHVEGYAPRDAVWMEPRTRLSGVVEKYTGEPPFDAPEALLAAAPEAPGSRWAAPELGDVPVCFLATGDTTGGSSGSPVLNGRGELVGVNFDRVWENVANDFGYNPEIARNISADVAYLLWMLETLEAPRSRGLLDELGVTAEAGR